MNLFKLFATLTLSSESYKRGIAEAKNENKGFEKSAQNTSKTAVTAWLAIAAAVMKVIQAVGKVIVDTQKYVDSIDKLSNSLGLSKQAVQEWQYVASQNDTTVESLSSSMKTLSTAAMEGNSDLRNLIGTVKYGNGQLKSQEQLLKETLTALNKIENPTERAAKANKVLGRSYQELGGIINLTTAELDAQIRTAHELGVVLSDDVVSAADKMGNELESMKLMSKAYFAELIFGDPERADEILDRYIEKVEEITPKFIQAGIKVFIAVTKALYQHLPTMAETLVTELVENIVEFWSQPETILNFVTMGFRMVAAVIGGVIKGIGKLIGKEVDLGGFGEFTSGGLWEGLNWDGSKEIVQSYSKAETIEKKSTYDINLKVEGETPVSKETAKDVGKVLVDILETVEGMR